MKKYYILLTAAAICALAACSKVAEQEIPAENTPADESQVTEWTYISAQGGEENVDGSSKASIDGSTAEFTWNTGDKIAVWSDGSYHISNGLASSFNKNASADFEFAGSINAGRANFAVFPASLVTETSSASATGLTLTLPATYALSEVKGDVSPTPMIAANAPGEGLAFKSVCALIRFTLISVPKQTQFITFDFNGKKVQGDFTLSGVDLSDLSSFTGVQTSATNGDDDVITVENNNVFSTFQKNLVVNIPVPAGVASTGEYTDVTITTWDGEPGNGGHKINALTSPIKTSSNWIPTRKSSRKRDVYLPVFTINGNIGLTNGTKAVFAPGNLQAILESAEPYVVNGNNKLFASQSWRFADHQYDALGSKTPHDVNDNDERNTYSINSLQDPKAGDPIDLFAWTGAQASYWSSERPEKVKYGIFVTTNGSGTSAYVGNTVDELLLSDWGHNVISDENGEYPIDTWRTPTKIEWDRVIQGRKDPANNSYLIAHGAKGKIVKSSSDPSVVAYGLFLLPDYFTYPAGVPILQKVAGTDVYTGSGGSANANYAQSSGGATCDDNSYTIAEWEKMEAAGCVFLPLTNHRHNATTPYKGEALYWNKDVQSGKNANWTLAFNYITDGYTASLPSTTANTLQSGKTTTRHYGCAVRLIRDVN